MANHLFDHFQVEHAPPDRIFLNLPDGSSLTYAQTRKASARIANALTELGLAAGDRLVIQAEKSALYLLTYLACVRAGIVFIPLNTAYTDNEVTYFIEDATPKLLIADPVRSQTLSDIAADRGTNLVTLSGDATGTLISATERQDTSFQNAERSADDLAAILYTSGTTGRSKGAMLSHENLASNARTLVSSWQFSHDDKLLHALPVFHTHGLFVATNTTLVAGGSMNLLPRFDVRSIIDWLPRSTAMMGVPTFYVRLLQEPELQPELVTNIRLFVSGSAPLLAETHIKWTQRTGHSILERYGMTETNMLTSNPYDGARVPGAVGPPLPGVSVRITDPDSANELPAGQIGMIEVAGPNVFSGYWNKPAETAESFRLDGFFITGDLGYIDENGYTYIVGRSKDLVISGGFNVYPKEVETELDAIDGIFESAVFGIPHSDFGEGVTAMVVPEPGASVDEATVLQCLRARLASYKCPKRIIIGPELPRNTMGKVQKNILRDRYADLYEDQS